ncbi:MAG: SDR family oxidoreductase [Actinomycetota bacterium]
MELGLAGRPALVAAASKGIGRAAAHALAAEGATVAICARDAGTLQATRDEIAEATGSTVVAIPTDVSTEEGARRFIREGAEALGGCEILIANADGPPVGRFEELSDDDFRAAADLVLFSALRMTREALPLMKVAGYGRVVIVSSIAVKQPIPGLVLSNSIRAAVLGWARTLADEVAADGVTVNAVLPGSIATDRIRWLLEGRAERSGRTVEEERAADVAAIPVGRHGEPHEVGDVISFLCSERASYLTGCFIQVDGGQYRGLL